MATAAAVLVCVLNLINRPLPPIVLLDTRPPDVSARAEAFVRRNPDTIFLLTMTTVFEDARRGERQALKKLASIIVHEETHLKHGPDERRAYSAQLLELLRLGESPGRPVYASVVRAMQFVTRGKPRDDVAVARFARAE
jgi:hypothetical protein